MSTTDSIDAAGTANLAFLEELFEQYQNDPSSVDPEWRSYFDAMRTGTVAPAPIAAAAHGAHQISGSVSVFVFWGGW